MKVCMPCTEADRERALLGVPFDEAPVFAFWDPATGEVTFESNPLADKEDACACSLTRWARKLDVDVFISADLGRRAASRLIKAGVRTLQAPIGTVTDVLEQYRSGALASTPTGAHSRACSTQPAGADQHPSRGRACCGHGHHGEEHHHRCGQNG